MTTYIPSLTLPANAFAEPAVSILLPVALGLGIGYAVSPSKKSTQKYLALKQPPYRPPPQVFGPVWTTLYGLMGYSAYRAWTIGTASLNPQTVAFAKVGIGILNQWNTADKEVDESPLDKNPGTDYVNEAPEGKKS
ncbi:hypothetical protein MMC07_009727, partial [Pseudocyphellaria aurata]|nr:hypothetical protein [Pseudocyphellaria aurata]